MRNVAKKVALLLLMTTFILSTFVVAAPLARAQDGTDIRFSGTVGDIQGSLYWVGAACVQVLSRSLVIGSVSVGDQVEVRGEDVSARIFLAPGDPCIGHMVVSVHESYHYIKRVGGTSQGRADLTFQKVVFDKPEPFQEGDMIAFGATIINQGDGNAYNCWVEVYLDGRLNDSGPIDLGAGEAVTIWSENPWRATGGTHVLEWRVDTTNAVAESNEGNNTKRKTFTVEETSNRYTLTIRTRGCGDTDPSEGTYTYDEGDRVSISADPCRGWNFDHWGGDASGSSSSTSVTMNSDKSVTAYFEEEEREYTLTIRTSGCGDTSPSEGTHTYDEGDRVSISADPCRGWDFDHWGGDASGTSSSKTITMNSNKTVTAYFVEEEREYTLTIRSSGCGDTDPSEGTRTYDEGDRVSVYADPCRGWDFDHWGGDASGSSTSKTITMNSDKSVTAYFVRRCPNYCVIHEMEKAVVIEVPRAEDENGGISEAGLEFIVGNGVSLAIDGLSRWALGLKAAAAMACGITTSFVGTLLALPSVAGWPSEANVLMSDGSVVDDELVVEVGQPVYATISFCSGTEMHPELDMDIQKRRWFFFKELVSSTALGLPEQHCTDCYLILVRSPLEFEEPGTYFVKVPAFHSHKAKVKVQRRSET